jgi:diguanylate cyclase (GGDEF)-like protein/PAS domain S-box-containing protein
MNSAPTETAPNRVVMARVAALMFISGAALTAIGLTLPQPPHTYVAGFEGIVIACIAVAVGLFVFGRLVPPWGFQVIIALGSLMVSAIIALRDGYVFASSIPTEMAYSFAILYAAYFFTRRATFAQGAIVALCYAAALVHTDIGFASAWVSWLVTTTILTVIGTVVFELRTRSERENAARRRATEEGEGSLSLLQATLESTADGLLVVDRQGHVVSFNQRLLEMWGLPEEVVETRDVLEVRRYVSDQVVDPDRFAAKLAKLDGDLEAESFDTVELSDGRVFERYSRPQRLDGVVIGRVWSFRDATDRHRFVDRLRKLADHDTVTGLFNRRRFEEEVTREVATAQRRDVGGALLVLDLDNFKDVNDAQGHACGDQVLREVAAILSSRVRRSDTVGRLGGDEFAVLLPEADPGQAKKVADELHEALRSHRFAFDGKGIRMTTSIGVVPIDGTESEGELLLSADMAMYGAKEAGRDRVQMHVPDDEVRAAAKARRSWAQRIREALDEGAFEFWAQPIHDLARDEVRQYELLARMRDEEGRLIPPGAFLGAAERLSLVSEIDCWGIQEAIRILAQHKGEDRPLALEVNISGRSISDPRLRELISSELTRTGVNPNNLILELTETAAISNMDAAIGFAESLARLGCRFALDDFGAGFGSIYYLKHLPVDFVKIDGDFVRNLPSSTTDQVVVASMVQIANGLGVLTIAESVGDAKTVEMLRRFGVDFAQGEHLGAPNPVDVTIPKPATPYASRARLLSKPG